MLRKRPSYWCYLCAGRINVRVNWSDATNLASVSIEIRVLALVHPELDAGHNRRRVICW